MTSSHAEIITTQNLKECQFSNKDAIMETQWYQVFEDYFNVALSKSKAVRWWSHLTDREKGIRGLTNTEMCDALEWRGLEFERSSYSGKPTLKDLKIWVFMFRKKDKINDDSLEQYDDYHDQLMIDIKTALQTAHTSLEMWNLICEPEHHLNAVQRTTTCRECSELIWYAGRTHGFKRTEFDLGSMTEKLKEIIIGGSAVAIEHKDYSDDIEDDDDMYAD